MIISECENCVYCNGQCPQDQTNEFAISKDSCKHYMSSCSSCIEDIIKDLEAIRIDSLTVCHINVLLEKLRNKLK